VLATFVVGMVNAMAFLLVIRVGFDMPMRGSIPLLLLGTALYVITLLSLGSAIAARVNTLAEANAAAPILFVPGLTLTGFIYPLTSVPKFLLPISYALPQTHFIEVVRGICLRGADLKELAPAFVYLTVAPIVLLLVASRRFSKSVSG
jgi:ABC-type multidrug transport system permease subunit